MEKVAGYVRFEGFLAHDTIFWVFWNFVDFRQREEDNSYRGICFSSNGGLLVFDSAAPHKSKNDSLCAQTKGTVMYMELGRTLYL